MLAIYGDLSYTFLFLLLYIQLLGWTCFHPRGEAMCHNDESQSSIQKPELSDEHV